jgi:hypothetical protein
MLPSHKASISLRYQTNWNVVFARRFLFPLSVAQTSLSLSLTYQSLSTLSISIIYPYHPSLPDFVFSKLYRNTKTIQH